MKCPYCGKEDARVIDSRVSQDGLQIRRRRLCENCGFRFTTIEKISGVSVIVIKKSGGKELFDREKLFKSIQKAFTKISFSSEDVENIVSKIESTIVSKGLENITSTEIGKMVMDELSKINKMAYIRYASVFGSIESIEDLKKIIDQYEYKEDKYQSNKKLKSLTNGGFSKKHLTVNDTEINKATTQVNFDTSRSFSSEEKDISIPAFIREGKLKFPTSNSDTTQKSKQKRSNKNESSKERKYYNQLF